MKTCLEKNFGSISDATIDIILQIAEPISVAKNEVITPHVASLINVETASDGVVENYKRLQKNEQLFNIVSTKNGY